MSTYIYEQFNKPGHLFSDATVQIIDYVDAGIFPTGSIKKKLLELEDFWINKLGTSFPLGLNDKKAGSGNVSKNCKVNYFYGLIIAAEELGGTEIG